MSFRVALQKDPKLAAEVGYIISTFALLELSVPVLLSKATGMAYEDADTALGHFRNISSRLDLADALAAQRGVGNADAVKAREFFSEIRACNKIRNKYAHSFYFQYWKGPWHVISWAGDATRKTTIEPMSIDIAQADRELLLGVLARVQHFGGDSPATVLPKEYYQQ